MTKKSVPDMKEVFRQAAEIAQQVPESMQEAAFNRALDQLLGPTQPPPDHQQRPPTFHPQDGSENTDGDASPEDLVRLIDSTQHPAVRSAGRVLDQSLMVLQIAFREHGVDGLTPVEISRILSEKFRLGTTRQAVGMALKNASHLVDRISEGRGFRYKIMAPGEEYLNHLTNDSPDQNGAKHSSKRGKSRRRKKAHSSQAKSGKIPKQENSTTKPRKKRGRNQGSASGKVGPKSAVMTLVQEGFFDTARTGPEVRDYLRKKRGHELGADQIRMAMLRLLRDSVLERDEREDGQYEYQRSS